MEHVAVTGLGVVSSIGDRVEAFWAALLDGRLAVEAVPGLADADEGGRWWSAVGKTFRAADWLPPGVLKSSDRFAQYALAAALQAVRDAGLDALPAERTAVVIGSSMGGAPTLAEAEANRLRRGERSVPARLMSLVIPNMAAAQVAMYWHLHGPQLTVSTACASSLDAIGWAARLVESGQVDYALAGGCETLLHPLIYRSLAHARAVSRASDPRRASRPFDRRRDGFLMGEGAGMVLLERLEEARARGVEGYGRILGYGSLADAHHVTSPDPSGYWEARAMEQALRDAALGPAAVPAIFAHGTGTPVGDAAEIRAVQQVWQDATATRWVTSIKGHIGHSMAASGVMALIAGVLGMRDGLMPPTLGTTEVDPEARFRLVLDQPAAVSYSVFQVNAFGFGGQNASLVVGR